MTYPEFYRGYPGQGPTSLVHSSSSRSASPRARGGNISRVYAFHGLPGEEHLVVLAGSKRDDVPIALAGDDAFRAASLLLPTLQPGLGRRDWEGFGPVQVNAEGGRNDALNFYSLHQR